ncbi:MAG: dihydrofolate reductase family protein [Acidobacteriota bacterium]
MRKLKLQMQLSVDGFVAGPNGELDWMTWDIDEKLGDLINGLIDSSDTIVMGRKMTDGFVNYWTGLLDKPDDPEYEFAKKMVDTPKVVFTRTLTKSPWANTTVAGDLVKTINEMKNAEGKDILAYGGAELVSNLIAEDLIDDYYLLVDRAAVGNGLRIFRNDSPLKLKLIDSVKYSTGVVLNQYQRA